MNVFDFFIQHWKYTHTANFRQGIPSSSGMRMGMKGLTGLGGEGGEDRSKTEKGED